MSEFRLPDVGEGLEQAEIIEWLVAPGDEVARDQPLVEILTDKSQTQLPSPRAGRIDRLGADVGEMVEVGAVLVVYQGADDSGSTTDAPPPNTAGETPERRDDGAPAATTPSVPSAITAPVAARPKAAPAVRRRAAERGIDLGSVTGTGPGGRITADDLDLHLRRPAAPASDRPTTSAPPAPAAAAGDLGQVAAGTHPMRGVRRVTAEHMTRAWAIPHIHGADEFDASALLDARAAIRARHADLAHLTPMTFMVMAVAHALRAFPMMNASLADDAQSFTVHPDVHVGVAVATDRGLVVPVVRHADRLGMRQTADELSRLTSSTRDGSIGVEELRGSTCTISNYGSLGGRFATPIINAPEVAIVGFGSIRERAIAVDGRVEARPTCPIATGADHRLIDGDLMTAFQEHIIATLRQPLLLGVG